MEALRGFEMWCRARRPARPCGLKRGSTHKRHVDKVPMPYPSSGRRRTPDGMPHRMCIKVPDRVPDGVHDATTAPGPYLSTNRKPCRTPIWHPNELFPDVKKLYCHGARKPKNAWRCLIVRTESRNVEKLRPPSPLPTESRKSPSSLRVVNRRRLAQLTSCERSNGLAYDLCVHVAVKTNSTHICESLARILPFHTATL